MDAYITVPERAVDGAFLMQVEDVFSISGRSQCTRLENARHTAQYGASSSVTG